MRELDDPVAVKAADPEDFLGVVEGFPQQVADGIEIGKGVDGLPKLDDIDGVAVCGMGGSGIGGDVLATSLRASAPVAVAAVKGYDLPAWVGPRSVVFACSYSGNTEETLGTTEQAIKAGAKVIAVTTGGALGELASNHGLPLAAVPSGLQPRGAMGYMAIPPLIMWDRMASQAHLPDAGRLTEEIESSIELLEQRAESNGRDRDFSSNQSKQTARSLIGKIPIIYGWDGLGEVAAYRWKCQFNECSKVPAWSSVFPELNHNEIVGWKQLAELTSKSLALILLRNVSTSGQGEHSRITRRIEITTPLIEDHFSLVREVWSGGSGVGALLDLIYVGDFVATYLAIAQGVDPTPVPVIEDLKRELGKP